MLNDGGKSYPWHLAALKPGNCTLAYGISKCFRNPEVIFFLWLTKTILFDYNSEHWICVLSHSNLYCDTVAAWLFPGPGMEESHKTHQRPSADVTWV